jgi:hypothetical protein
LDDGEWSDDCSVFNVHENGAGSYNEYFMATPLAMFSVELMKRLINAGLTDDVVQELADQGFAIDEA